MQRAWREQVQRDGSKFEVDNITWIKFISHVSFRWLLTLIWVGFLVVHFEVGGGSKITPSKTR